jgi:hypothetical protein
MMFNRNGSGLDKSMLVVVIFPVSFLAVPIPVVMAMFQGSGAARTIRHNRLSGDHERFFASY